MSPEAGWILQEEVVPRLASAIPQAVHCVGCEDPEELIQDATAIAAKMLDNVDRAKKKVTSGNIAYYTIQHIKSGRRSTGSSVVDVYGSGTQLHGRSRFTSLDDTAAIDEENGGEIFEFHDVLSNDAEDPSMTAARRLDWQEFWAGLSERERAVIVSVAEGQPLQKAARLFKVSASTIQDTKRKLGIKLLEFMGADILAQVRRQPRWKDLLVATRERLACRDERKRL
jgi:hypothetical protein